MSSQSYPEWAGEGEFSSDLMECVECSGKVDDILLKYIIPLSFYYLKGLEAWIVDMI